MSPRSSRSHCTLVPAASMIASMPYVASAVCAPRDDRERAVLAAFARTRAAVVAEHEVEHAAGAERDLGVAVAHAALADERRLLIAEQARRSAARRAARSPAPTIAGRVDDRRHHRGRGCRAARASSRPSRRGRACLQSGDRGVGGVGHVRAPVVSVHAIHVSTVPKQRSRPRSRSSSWSSSHFSLVADWLGARRSALRRAARGTRRPCGGPASRCPGRPARRSRDPTRWSTRVGSEMPTASTGPAASSAAVRDVEARARHRGRVELARCRRRASRGAARCATSCAKVPSARDDRGADAARADVDDEHAAVGSLTARRASPNGRRAGRACPG